MVRFDVAEAASETIDKLVGISLTVERRLILYLREIGEGMYIGGVAIEFSRESGWRNSQHTPWSGCAITRG